MKFDWELRAFEDVSGHLRFVRACPITRLDELKDCLDLLHEAIASHPETFDFPSLYSESKIIQQLVAYILQLCNVSTDWIDVPMMVELIHHRVDKDGNFLPGLLVEINFPQSQKESETGVAVTFKEWVANTIVELVTSGLVRDLQQAIQLAGTIPYDQLCSYLLARRYHLNPKLKKQEEIEKLNSLPTNREDEVVLNFASNNVSWRDDVDISKYL